MEFQIRIETRLKYAAREHFMKLHTVHFVRTGSNKLSLHLLGALGLIVVCSIHTQQLVQGLSADLSSYVHAHVCGLCTVKSVPCNFSEDR